jgi:hypothetical protein
MMALSSIEGGWCLVLVLLALTVHGYELLLSLNLKNVKTTIFGSKEGHVMGHDGDTSNMVGHLHRFIGVARLLRRIMGKCDVKKSLLFVS